VILFHLFGGKLLRFSDLERAIPAVSQYGLTPWGQALCPALDALLKWAALREKLSETERETS
jgi:DNA-binding HxlR family transcriptional regulator